MSTLIVTLPLDPSAVSTLYDYVWTTDGSTVGDQSRSALGLLPSAGETVALIPALRLSWHQVKLPTGTLARGFLKGGGSPRLRAVLDGLLEDRLLDDTSQLHFAIEPKPRADALVWVAVCDRAWLRAGLQALERAGRPASRVVPEFVPEALPGVVYVMGEPDAAYMVFTARGGVQVWPLSSASVALLGWPDDSDVVAEPAVAALAEQIFKRPVTLQQGAQRCLQAAQSPWDLAQFDLVNSSRTRTWKRWSNLMNGFFQAPQWRPARLAMLVLLGVNLIGLNAWAWKEQAMINTKRQAVREILTSTFPGVRVVVDASLQMSREVAALQQGSGAPTGRDLESMLSAFGAVANAGQVPIAIDYAASELRMKGLPVNADEVTSMSFKLKTQGYAASLDGDTLVIRQVATP